ncbi:hypothetical protein [Arthrobacter sp. SO3]|uniref:hypothetical protein n=1 Tax=Arthrobacter sp. SO3 TaxID=1897057 RepID=UPI001CFF971A|nr:hypothetical protein [Arthrobacter sp. SO3]MCB5294177.1 hypothetical protein [Arthrobacter sp. SO3]
MLGFLSNLRDVKSALSAGMLLLFAVWLLIGEQIAKVAPGDTLAGKVATLVDYLGPVATLAVITFLAYVVGLIFPFHLLVLAGINRHNRKRAEREGDKTRESRLLDFIQDQVGRAVRKKSVGELTKDLVREIPALTKMGILYPWWIRLSPRFLRSSLERRWNNRVVRQALKSKQPDGKEPPQVGSFGAYRAGRTEQKDLASALLRRIHSESALLAVDLGQKDDKAYERFDKARSESEFRSGLCIPLLILTTVTALQLPPDQFLLAVGVCGIGLFSVLVLALRAAHKAREAQEEVDSAIVLGRIKVPELQVLEGAINEDTATPSRGGTILRSLLPKK